MDFSQTSTLWDTPQEIVNSRKFDTAIRDTFDVVLRGPKEEWGEDELLIVRLLPEADRDSLLTTTPEHYGIFLKSILSPHKCKVTSRNRELTHRVVRAMGETYRVQSEFCQLSNHLETKNRIIRAVHNESMTLPTELINLLEVSERMTSVITKSNRMYGPKYMSLEPHERRESLAALNHMRFDDLRVEFRWSHKYLLICLDGKWYLAPKSVLLMYHNKVCDLISVLLLAKYTESSCLPKESYDTTLQMIQLLISMLIRYKNKFFHIAKALEAFVTGENIMEAEEWENKEFLKEIVESVFDSSGFDYDTSELRDLLKSVPIPLRQELGCLSKVLGHPLVSMKEGAQKLHEKTNAHSEIDMDYVVLCINYCKSDYIKKNILKYRKWPPSTLNSPATPKGMEMAFIHNRDPDSLFIRSKFGAISVRDYIFVDILPNKRLNVLENILPYLKDKTISLMRSIVVQKYINHQKVSRAHDSWKETRLLLTFLLHPTLVHSHTDYLEKYCECEDLEVVMDYLVIRIVPKEKELKIDFRGFGCKTYEDRCRALAQEKNVMQYLDEFSDEQAMTLSELALIRKLDAFRRLQTVFKEYEPLYIVIDSSAWNNRFRDLTVDSVMSETLDKVYDTTLFGRTHAAYLKTLIYVPDADTTYFWEGQGGGIEGLNQDTWVVVYINQIKVAIADMGFRYHILCKGDDLRVIFLIPKTLTTQTPVAELKRNIVTRISQALSKFGHKINIEESYGSSVYLAFSKEASIRNCILPQSFRKIQKAHGANNAFINTTDDYVASAFSNAHSACKTSPIVSGCFKVGVFWACWYIVHSQAYQNITDNMLVAAMLIPSLLGGFPVIYLHNMAIRAESDLLSPFLMLYKYLERKHPDIADIVARFMYCKSTLLSTWVQLYQDPYSLPTARPALPAGVLRSYIRPILERHTKNEIVTELFKYLRTNDAKLIIECLDSCNIVKAKAMNLIYSATPHGALDTLLRQFESGRSILELFLLKLRRRATNRILRTVIRAELRLQRWRSSRLSGTRYRSSEESFIHMIDDCPTRSAERIRAYFWQKPVHDVSLPPMQHQISITPALGTAMNDWPSRNHFTYTFSDSLYDIPKSYSEHYATGTNQPFLGYTTPSGSLNPNVHFIAKDALVSKLKQLLDLIPWLSIESRAPDGTAIVGNAGDLIRKMIKSYTDIPASSLAPFQAPRKSGTQNHHLKSRGFKDSIVPNTLGNTLTRFSGESNTHITLREHPGHYLVNFLHILCYVHWISTWELEIGRYVTTPHTFWAVTTSCPFCTHEIQEAPMIFDANLIKLYDPEPLQSMKLGEVSSQIIVESLETFREQDLVKIEAAPEDAQIELAIACCGLLQEFVDTTYSTKVRLQERFGSHAQTSQEIDLLATLTQSNQKKTIGITELKCMSADIIGEGLIEFVASLMQSLVPGLSRGAVNSYLLLHPTSELPWTTMIEWLRTANKLPDVMRVIGSMCGMPPGMACYETPTAARFVANAASMWFRQYHTLPHIQVVILSYYTSEHLLPHIRRKANILMHSWIHQFFPVPDMLRGFQSTIPMAVDASIRIGMRVLACYIASYRSEILWMEQADNILANPHETVRYYILDSTDITEGSFENVLTAEDSPLLGSRLMAQVYDKLSNAHEGDENLHEAFDQQVEYLKEYIGDLENPPFIELTRSTLSDCIDLVRSNPIGRKEDVQDMLMGDENDGWIYETMRPIDFRVLGPDCLPGITAVLGHQHEIDALPVENPAPIHAGIWSGLVIDPAWHNRYYGSANSSSTVALDIMMGLKIKQAIHDIPRLHIMCLCDGVGGFTDVLNVLTNHATILWHTVPTDRVLQPIPLTSMQSFTKSNRIITQIVDQGFVDLRLDTTWEAIRTVVGSACIITCDIEPNATSDREYYEVIMAPIISRILCHLNIGGHFILRVDLEFPKAVHQIIGILRSHFDRVIMWRPPSETYASAIYICSLSLRGVLSYDDIPRHVLILRGGAATSLNSLRKLMQEVQTQVNALDDLATPVTDDAVVTASTYYMTDHLQVYGFSRLAACLHVQVPTAEELQTCITEYMKYPSHTCLQNTSLNLSPIRRRLEARLGDVLGFTHNTILDYNTRSHHVAILRSLFNCYGYEHGILVFLSSNLYRRPSTLDIYSRVVDYCETLHPRYLLGVNITTLPTEDRDPHQSDRYLFESYIEGFHSAMAVASYIKKIAEIKRRAALPEVRNLHIDDEPREVVNLADFRQVVQGVREDILDMEARQAAAREHAAQL